MYCDILYTLMLYRIKTKLYAMFDRNGLKSDLIGVLRVKDYFSSCKRLFKCQFPG